MFLPSLIFVFCFGLIWGSFLNVWIYRIPRKTFPGKKRSFCPDCGESIPFYYNIPVFSYLILLGKSACCKKRISLIYPVVELLTGSLFTILFWKLRINLFELPFISFNDFMRLSHGLLFISLMTVCSFIDFNFMIIPDRISLPAIAATPLIIFFQPELSWKSGLLGILLGAGLIYAIAWFYYLIRKEEGIGMGDAKLLALIGGWLGYEAIFPVIFCASIFGSIISIITLAASKKLSLKTYIPFGPFLALGALIQLLSPVSFWSWFS